MRGSRLVAVLAFAVSACTFLFPLEESFPDGAAPPDATTDVAPPDAPADVQPDVRAYAAEVLADAPVLYLRFGEKDGTTAKDERGTRQATYGAAVTLGAQGALLNDPDTAVTFDGGLSSTISIPPGLDFAGKAPFSVEVWALQTATTDYGWAVDHQVYGPTNGWALRFSPAQISFERTVDAQFAPIQTPVPLKKNTYQHVVATFDGTNGVLYVDGNAVQTRDSPLSLKPMTSSWTAGAQNCGCKSSNFIGSLDELAVYDKALGADRVLAHYRASGR